MVVIMQIAKRFVGIGEAAKILGTTANNLRAHEIVAEDGNRYLVKGEFKIRVYDSLGGQRRYLIADLDYINYVQMRGR